jgi:hypothetical protein
MRLIQAARRDVGYAGLSQFGSSVCRTDTIEGASQVAPDAATAATIGPTASRRRPVRKSSPEQPVREQKPAGGRRKTASCSSIVDQ